MKRLLVLAFILWASIAQAATVTNFFEAIDATGAQIKGVKGASLSSFPASHDIKDNEGKVIQKRYRVYVTTAEYDAGWAALAQAKKDAAKAAAQDEREDFELMFDKLLKAYALTALDENNNVRGWLADFKTEVAAATTLADLKTRVAGLPDMPDRTEAQLKAAVKAKYQSLP